jgi:hypothetical protein
MKSLITAMLLLPLLAFGRSKPFEGFTVYLLGAPGKEKVWVNQIPQGESAIYSLVETATGNVFGGTRVVFGQTPWIFYFNAKKRKIENKHLWPLKKFIPGEKCINALVSAKNGNIYGATSNLINIDYSYAKDITKGDYPGSHLFSFPQRPGKFKIKDLGIPFKGEGIAALLIGKRSKVLYGITVPSQIFFKMDIATNKVTVIDSLTSLEVQHYRYIGKTTRALVRDNMGNVYGSCYEGKMFKYHVKTNKIEVLETELPTDGEASYDCLSAFIRTARGRIFGGTFLDGKLFEFYPRTGKIRNLGITSRTGNISGLAVKGNIVFGLSGSFESRSRLFLYNLNTGEYKHMPFFKAYFHNTEDLIKWRPLHLRNFLVLKNGMLVTGEDDANGHLFTYMPTKIKWSK